MIPVIALTLKQIFNALEMDMMSHATNGIHAFANYLICLNFRMN